ncbi:pectinesterase inhibitor-like [Magnolia sinica]|uniref:pectinesterase inhibitor-like n=1 Tax=Magnolia sinica TaxID=86752 RepID=UPI00265A4720|nr:pectinesterase inhibitor-like [Magnolia sinica]
MSTLSLKFLVGVFVLLSIYQPSIADGENAPQSAPQSSPAFNVPAGKDPTLIRETCKLTKNSDECVKNLEADVRSYDATDAGGLAQIAIEHVVANANHLYVQANALKSKPGYDDQSIRAMETCSKLYGEAVDTLMQGRQAVGSKDYKSANIYVSEAIDASDTCTQEFEESARKMPFARRNKMVKDQASIALDIIAHLN